MASFFGRCKCVLFNVLIVFSIYSLVTKCPGSTSSVCVDYYNPVYENYLAPGYVQYVEPIYESYLAPVYGSHIEPFYGSSIEPIYVAHVKSHVECFSGKAIELYNQHLADGVSQIQTKIQSGYKCADEHVFSVYGPVIKQQAISTKAVVVAKTVELSKLAHIHFNTKIVPLTQYYYSIFLAKSKLYGNLALTKFNFYWDLTLTKVQYYNKSTICPFVEHHYQETVAPILSQIYTILKIDFVVEKLAEVYETLHLENFSNKTSEFVDYVKEQKQHYIKDIEGKQNFLKTEFLNLINNRKKTVDESVENFEEVEVVSFDEMKEEEDEEDITETIIETLTKTVTAESSEIPVEIDVPVNGEISVNDQIKMSEEIVQWQQLIFDTCGVAHESFLVEVRELETHIIDSVMTSVSEDLQSAQVNSYESYKSINGLIGNITVFDDESDEYFVSRQAIRDVLKQSQDDVVETNEKITALLEESRAQLIQQILIMKQSTIDTLEEFADASIPDISKKILNQASNPNWGNWKQVKKIREIIYSTRDQILNYDSLSEFERYTSEIDFTMGFLIRDSGSYLSVLRAKANLSFQTREEKERLGLVNDVDEEQQVIAEEKREDEEEDVTVTISETQTVTGTLIVDGEETVSVIVDDEEEDVTVTVEETQTVTSTAHVSAGDAQSFIAEDEEEDVTITVSETHTVTSTAHVSAGDAKSFVVEEEVEEATATAPEILTIRKTINVTLGEEVPTDLSYLVDEEELQETIQNEEIKEEVKEEIKEESP